VGTIRQELQASPFPLARLSRQFVRRNAPTYRGNERLPPHTKRHLSVFICVSYACRSWCNHAAKPNNDSNRNPLRDSKTFRTTPGEGRDQRRTQFQNRVIELPNASRYRFFSKSWRKMAHANFSQGNTLAPPALRSAPRLGSLLPRRRVSSSRRHAFPAAPRPHGRLLLPLRGIQSPRRLRENVRVQKICLPLVGHQLRQASLEHATPRRQRRPEISASTPHRTRPPVALTAVRAATIGRRSTEFRVERFRIHAVCYTNADDAFIRGVGALENAGSPGRAFGGIALEDMQTLS